MCIKKQVHKTVNGLLHMQSGLRTKVNLPPFPSLSFHQPSPLPPFISPPSLPPSLSLPPFFPLSLPLSVLSSSPLPPPPHLPHSTLTWLEVPFLPTNFVLPLSEIRVSGNTPEVPKLPTPEVSREVPPGSVGAEPVGHPTPWQRGGLAREEGIWGCGTGGTIETTCRRTHSVFL